jgi:hypothetical protein
LETETLYYRAQPAFTQLQTKDRLRPEARKTNKHIGRMKYSPHRDSSRQFHALQEPLKSGVALQGISPGFDLKEGDAVGPHFISLVQVGKSLIFLPRGGMDNPGPPATPERSHLTKRVTSLLHTLS